MIQQRLTKIGEKPIYAWQEHCNPNYRYVQIVKRVYYYSPSDMCWFNQNTCKPVGYQLQTYLERIWVRRQMGLGR